MIDKQDEILKRLTELEKKFKDLENDFYNLDGYLPNHSIINKSILFIEKKESVSREDLKKRFSINEFRAIKLVEILVDYGFLDKEEDEEGSRKVNKEAFFQFAVPPELVGDLDSIFDKAVLLVSQYDKVSASLIQRRFGLGYARAARLLDQLEAKGIVGPAEGAKPREVIKRK